LAITQLLLNEFSQLVGYWEVLGVEIANGEVGNVFSTLNQGLYLTGNTKDHRAF
jgi:hypothetical protein